MMKKIILAVLTVTLLIGICTSALAASAFNELFACAVNDDDGANSFTPSDEIKLNGENGKYAWVVRSDKQGTITVRYNGGETGWHGFGGSAGSCSVVKKGDNYTLEIGGGGVFTIYTKKGKIIGLNIESNRYGEYNGEYWSDNIPEDDPPKTGDTAPLALYALLIALGVAGVALTFSGKRI